MSFRKIRECDWCKVELDPNEVIITRWPHAPFDLCQECAKKWDLAFLAAKAELMGVTL